MDTIAPDLIRDAESAHTIGRKSVRNPPIEIITGHDRRRTWTLEQKREIVAEILGPALTPTEVARRYSISSGHISNMRQCQCRARNRNGARHS